MARPNLVDQVRAHAPPSPQQQHDITDKPLRDRHIILLDDDEVLRPALSEQLRSWGAHVSQAGSLEDLDELLQRVMQVDLLLTDHRLPDGNGRQAIEMALTKHPRLNAIIITGDTSAAPLLALRASGVPVFHKPFDSTALLRCILLKMQPGKYES